MQNECGYVLQVPAADRCHFVMETDDCHETETYFDYMSLLFCSLEGKSPYWGISILVNRWERLLTPTYYNYQIVADGMGIDLVSGTDCKCRNNVSSGLIKLRVI